MHKPGGISSLVEFSYESDAAPGITAASLLRLAQQAWSFNTRIGISGELRLADGRFFQVIEGPSDTLLALSSRIMTDRRHGAIRVDSLRPIGARRFGGWSTAGFGLEDFASVFARSDNGRTQRGRSLPGSGVGVPAWGASAT